MCGLENGMCFKNLKFLPNFAQLGQKDQLMSQNCGFLLIAYFCATSHFLAHIYLDFANGSYIDEAELIRICYLPTYRTVPDV